MFAFSAIPCCQKAFGVLKASGLGLDNKGHPTRILHSELKTHVLLPLRGNNKGCKTNTVLHGIS